MVLNDMGSEKNCWFRQVTSYWEMASALVNHGILAQELFVDANSEPFFLAAKFWPYLQEIPRNRQFLMQMERLLERSAGGRQKLKIIQVSRNVWPHLAPRCRKAGGLMRRRSVPAQAQHGARTTDRGNVTYKRT